MNEIPEPVNPNAESKIERIRRLLGRAGDHVQTAMTDPKAGRLEWDGEVKPPASTPISQGDIDKFVRHQDTAKFDKQLHRLNNDQLPPPPKLENPQS